MSRRIPLNEPECDVLEFKSRDALREPATIGREVVAMLNAGGGEVWIGIREERGVAKEIEDIDDPQAARRSLHDALIERIEPLPLADEVRVEIVADQGRHLLVVSVEARPERGPYDLLHRGGRHFVVRVGDRLRHLGRDEIRERFRNAVADDVERTDRVLRAREEELLREGSSILWLGFAPLAGSARLRLDRLLRREYLQDPAATGVRRSGYSVVAALQAAPLTSAPAIRKVRPERGTSRAVIGVEGVARLSISREAEVHFEAPLESVRSFTSIPEFENRRVVYPAALLEYIVSTFRLVGKMLGDDEAEEDGIWSSRPEQGMAVRLALVGVGGWILVPGRDDDLRLWQVLRNRVEPFPDPAFGLPSPEVFTLTALEREPDRCAWRLSGGLYEGFGYERQQVPYFDPARGTFRFP
jgi:hypothetical protein